MSRSRKLTSTTAIAASVIAATALAGAAVSVGLVQDGAQSDPAPESVIAADRADQTDLADLADLTDLAGLADRAGRTSRSGGREAVARRVRLSPQAVDHDWATARLNVWRQPAEKGRRVGLIEAGTRLAVTGQQQGHWAEVLLAKGAVRWVNADYLSDHKPAPAASPSSSSSPSGSSSSSAMSVGGGGVSGAPCPDGSATESGITANAVRMFRAVCNAFPALTTYGGYDAHGEHADGRAIDFMISDPALGQAVADWVRANAAALQVRDVIWSQHIWTPEQASAGWRPMSDRGSPTANHYDHVHVAVN